jgi:hypothetical protein
MILMKYFFDSHDLPPEQKKWIAKQRQYVGELVEANKKRALIRIEDNYLEQWNYHKNKIDELSKIRKPNICEEILILRFELTKYNELLKYIHEKSPHKRVKIPKSVG